MPSRIFELLIFIMLFNGALGYVSSVTATTGSGAFFGNYKVTNYAGWSPNVIQSQLQCQIYANGTNVCTPQVSSAASVVTNILIFGDYLTALRDFVVTMVQGIVLPGYFLIQFFGQGAIGFAFLLSIGMWVLYLYATIMIISGRYPE